MITFTSIANTWQDFPDIWYVQYVMNMGDGTQQSDFIKYKNKLPPNDVIITDIQTIISAKNNPPSITVP